MTSEEVRRCVESALNFVYHKHADVKRWFAEGHAFADGFLGKESVIRPTLLIFV
jgi:hypothetical protein